MKIDNSLKSTGTPAGESRTGKGSKAESGSKAPEAGVSVELSGLSTQLQSLEVQVSGGEVVDAARVAEIKQAIAEGRFKVNPDVVADRLLQTVRELIRSYRS
jgi:negative regulator of flagellin synthesis FlgM